MTATASITTPTRIDGTAALFIAHLVSSVMYHADRDKGKCDLYGEQSEGTLDDKSSRIPDHAGTTLGVFFRFTALIFEKRSPRDVRRQISDVASDARKVSFSRIIDETRRRFTRFQISQRLK